jgi:hypothetical protein
LSWWIRGSLSHLPCGSTATLSNSKGRWAARLKSSHIPTNLPPMSMVGARGQELRLRTTTTEQCHNLITTASLALLVPECEGSYCTISLDASTTAAHHHTTFHLIACNGASMASRIGRGSDAAMHHLRRPKRWELRVSSATHYLPSSMQPTPVLTNEIENGASHCHRRTGSPSTWKFEDLRTLTLSQPGNEALMGCELVRSCYLASGDHGWDRRADSVLAKPSERVPQIGPGGANDSSFIWSSGRSIVRSLCTSEIESAFRGAKVVGTAWHGQVLFVV